MRSHDYDWSNNSTWIYFCSVWNYTALLRTKKNIIFYLIIPSIVFMLIAHVIDSCGKYTNFAQELNIILANFYQSSSILTHNLRLVEQGAWVSSRGEGAAIVTPILGWHTLKPLIFFVITKNSVTFVKLRLRVIFDLSWTLPLMFPLNFSSGRHHC